MRFAKPAVVVDGEGLLFLVEELAAELRGGRRPTAGLDSKLDAELGLDSLARMELLLRIQRRFGVRLAEEQALGAETPRALLAALAAAPAAAPEAAASPAPPAQPAAARVSLPPAETPTLLDALAWYAAAHP